MKIEADERKEQMAPGTQRHAWMFVNWLALVGTNILWVGAWYPFIRPALLDEMIIVLFTAAFILQLQTMGIKGFRTRAAELCATAILMEAALLFITSVSLSIQHHYPWMGKAFLVFTALGFLVLYGIQIVGHFKNLRTRWFSGLWPAEIPSASTQDPYRFSGNLGKIFGPVPGSNRHLLFATALGISVGIGVFILHHWLDRFNSGWITSFLFFLIVSANIPSALITRARWKTARN